MAFKTFTVGEVLTASDVNAYLMKQTMIVCTSGTRPASPAEGFHIYETDTDKELIYTGAAWVQIAQTGVWETYVPTWTTTGTAPALGNGTLVGRFVEFGKTVLYGFTLTAGSTTTFGTGGWSISTPTARAANITEAIAVTLFDTSAANEFSGGGRHSASTVVLNSSTGLVTATVPFTWANGDSVRGAGMYERS